jgi:hypothetical protein
MQKLLTARVRIVIATALSLVLGGSAGAFALHGRSDVRPLKDMTVFDGEGRLVGHVHDLEGLSALVRLQIDGYLATVLVGTTGFEDATADTTRPQRLLFESPDCSGNPLLDGTADPAAMIPFVFKNGSRLYVHTGPDRTVQVLSVLETDGFCSELEFESQVTAARLLVDLAEEFEPPFQVRIR